MSIGRPSRKARTQSSRVFGLLSLLTLIGLCWRAEAAEQLPPAPKQYFNDYAGVVSPATASRLNKTLEDVERETSNQILVVLYPHMESDSSIEDYTVRVAQSWRVGQKAKNNGAVLFVFIQDRKMFLQVGYGLEGALPDALAKRIIENEIKPRFKNGDYDGGLSAGIGAILAATKGEYKGTGATAGDQGQGGLPGGLIFLVVAIVFIALLLMLARRRGLGYAGSGWTLGSGGFSGGNWGSGGGGWGGGGDSGSSGFSSGGGSFGGGGAGGSW